MPTKQQQKELEDFLSKHEVKTTDFEEVETVPFERNQLYNVTLLSHHQFDGKFGPSVVINYEGENGKAKAYLSGYEVNHFANFIEGKTLPLDVQLARTQSESKENEGRVFNRLIIAEV